MSTTIRITICSSHAFYPHPGDVEGKEVFKLKDQIVLSFVEGKSEVDVDITAGNISKSAVNFEAVRNSGNQIEAKFLHESTKYTFSACPLDANAYHTSDLTQVAFWVGILTRKIGSEDSGGTWTGK